MLHPLDRISFGALGGLVLAGVLAVTVPKCPAPTPAPAPTPTPVQCPLALPDLDLFAVEVKTHGGQQLDVTVFACGALVTAVLSNCGASCCALADEKGAVNGACAFALYGPPDV